MWYRNDMIYYMFKAEFVTLRKFKGSVGKSRFFSLMSDLIYGAEFLDG